MSHPEERYRPSRCAVYECPHAPCATEKSYFGLLERYIGFYPLCEAHAREAYAEGRKVEWWAADDQEPRPDPTRYTEWRKNGAGWKEP